MAVRKRKLLTMDEAKSFMIDVFLHIKNRHLKIFHLVKENDDSENGLTIKEDIVRTLDDLSQALDSNIIMIHVINKSGIIEHELHVDPRDVSRKLKKESETKNMDVLKHEESETKDINFLKYLKENEGISEDQIGIKSPDDVGFVMKINELLASEITEMFMSRPELLDKYYLMFLPYTDNNESKIRLALYKDKEVLYRTTFNKKDNDIIINMEILKFREYVKELIDDVSSR